MASRLSIGVVGSVSGSSIVKPRLMRDPVLKPVSAGRLSNKIGALVLVTFSSDKGVFGTSTYNSGYTG